MVSFLIALVALTTLASPTWVVADVLFDNYESSYSSTQAVGVTGPVIPCGAPYDEAMPFVVPSDPQEGYALDSVTLPMLYFTELWCLPTPNTLVTVSVCGDDGGVPGLALETIQMSVTTTSAALETVDFSGDTSLNAGARYWIVLSGVDDSDHWWMSPTALPTGSRMYRQGSGDSWHTSWNISDAAFRVEGTPLPQVSTDVSTWGRIKAIYK